MVNDKGLALIKAFEGCQLKAYQDLGGVWTCGWGSTGSDIGPTTVWTQEYADNRLLRDISNICAGVDRLVKKGTDVNENQYAALVCFSYNLGVNTLRRSTLLRLIYARRDPKLIANEFLRWDCVKGKEVEGLERRRRAEAALFLRPDS